MINKYRKKPTVVEAMQWTGGNALEIFNFVGFIDVDDMRTNSDILIIYFPECVVRAKIGDYIIKKIDNMLYSVAEDVFLKTYEQVDNE